MGWNRFDPPVREDYDSEEEYLDAYEAWERAEDDYAEDYMERIFAERE